MKSWARALLLAAVLLGTVPALAQDDDSSEEAPAMPTEAQAAGIRAALGNLDPAVQREAFRLLARAGWAHWPGEAQNSISIAPAEAAARLDDPDPDVCRAAVILLGHMGLAADSPSAKKIAALRADRRSAVAQAAARSFRQIEAAGESRKSAPPAPGLEETLRQFMSEDPAQRLAAAEALIIRRGETPEIARAAAPAFADEGEGAARPVVADLLRRAPGPPGTLPGELAALLLHVDAKVRCAALQAFGRVTDWTSVHLAAIAALLGDGTPAVRAESARTLARSHVAMAAAPFAAAVAANFADPDAEVRESAAESLGQLGPTAATPHLPALAALLADPEPDVRLGAVRALSSLGETATHAEEIVSLLGTRPTGGVILNRDAVSAALMRLNEAPPAALQALATRCADPDPEVRALAAEVLGLMSAGFVEKAMDATGEFKPGAKPDFSRWSGGPAAACAPAVAALLGDPDHYVRAEALNALGMMGRDGAAFVREVAACLRDRDPEMRCTALRTLGRMGAAAMPHARGVAALRRDPVPGVRAEAVRTLGLLPGDFTPLLLESARDSSAEVRHAALDILDDPSLAQPPVTAAILARLEDRDEGVRGVAAGRLNRLAERHPSFLARFATRLADRRPAARQAAVERLDAMVRETEEAGPARDLVVAVLRVLPGLNEEERARLRAHLHVWAGQFFQEKRPCLQPAVAWLGRPRRVPSPSSLGLDEAREALVAFREVWDGTDAKRDSALRRETAQRAAEVAAGLPTAPDAATAKVLEEWTARVGAQPEFKDVRRAVEDVLKRRPATP